MHSQIKITQTSVQLFMKRNTTRSCLVSSKLSTQKLHIQQITYSNIIIKNICLIVIKYTRREQNIIKISQKDPWELDRGTHKEMIPELATDNRVWRGINPYANPRFVPTCNLHRLKQVNDLKLKLFHGITLVYIELIMLPRNSKVSLQLKNECVLRTSSLQSANQFLSHQVEHTFHTLLIVFLGYAIDWGISPSLVNHEA